MDKQQLYKQMIYEMGCVFYALGKKLNIVTMQQKRSFNNHVERNIRK